MSGLIIHHDQTSKQPVVWQCFNPICSLAGPFEFESDYPVCPKCGNDGAPGVQKRVLMHYLLPDREGKIQGQFSRYRMACDKTREHLATLTNGEAATGMWGDHINCRGCRAAIGNDVLKTNGHAVDVT